MDLRKVKESKNFEDQTGYTKVDKMLDTLFTRLNPVYAYRNLKGARRQGIDFHGAPVSENVIDRTGAGHIKDVDYETFKYLQKKYGGGFMTPEGEMRQFMPHEQKNLNEGRWNYVDVLFNRAINDQDYSALKTRNEPEWFMQRPSIMTQRKGK